MTEQWVPELESQNAPFESGNTAALRHGTRSPQSVDPLAERKLTELLSDPAMPEYLTADESYRLASMALARAEAVIELLAVGGLHPGEERSMTTKTSSYSPRTCDTRLLQPGASPKNSLATQLITDRRQASTSTGSGRLKAGASVALHGSVQPPWEIAEDRSSGQRMADISPGLPFHYEVPHYDQRQRRLHQFPPLT